jgi:hypothetical protein
MALRHMLVVLVWLLLATSARAQPASTAPAAPASPAAPEAAASQPAGQLYPPRVQLDSWPMRIFVTRDIAPETRPVLRLYYADGAYRQALYCDVAPVNIARRQVWVGGADSDGQDAQHVGTWLLFTLKPHRPAASALPGTTPVRHDCSVPGLKSVARVQPVLSWTEAGCAGECQLFASIPHIYLGNAWKATAYALAVLVAFIGLTWLGVRLASKAPGLEYARFRSFFVVDHAFSLSLFQMGLWTCAVGFMVLYQLFAAFDAASIPESLIALMGTSLLTAGASAVLSQNAKEALTRQVAGIRESLAASAAGAAELAAAKRALSSLEAALKTRSMSRGLTPESDALVAALQPVLAAPVAAAVDPAKAQAAADALQQAAALLQARIAQLPDPNEGQVSLRRRLVEMLTAEGDAAEGKTLSLSRLQMLFWTVIIIIMFIAKSIIAGLLWDIPWTLVALMGVSQLGYIGGKFGQTTQGAATAR